jgi:toxin ParE1/3/4
MTVVWSRRAIDNLIALREYIAKDSPRSAGSVARGILDAVDLLTTQPHIGRAGRIAGTRELVVPGTPCVIPYRVRGGRLELLAVFHGRQK